MKYDYDKMCREIPYYKMVLKRLIDDMHPNFYNAHKELLDELAFTINAHEQDNREGHKHGNDDSK